MSDSGQYQDKPLPYASGWLALLAFAILGYIAYELFASGSWILGGALGASLLFLLSGFFILQPNQGMVATFFGNYSGSALEPGFFYTNPLYSTEKISLKTDNYNSQSLKVNDKRGNPIEIGAVVSWRVSDAARATFMVEDYEAFLVNQSESAIREVATRYPYDHLRSGEDGESAEKTLRGDIAEISGILRRAIQEHAEMAGIEILEAKIIHLAYAPEIAQAMLRRQQAEAVVSARERIVEGAVKMTEQAVRDLGANGLLSMDESAKSALAINLMTVLVADSGASPVLPMASAAARKPHE